VNHFVPAISLDADHCDGESDGGGQQTPGQKSIEGEETNQIKKEHWEVKDEDDDEDEIISQSQMSDENSNNQRQNCDGSSNSIIAEENKVAHKSDESSTEVNGRDKNLNRKNMHIEKSSNDLPAQNIDEISNNDDSRHTTSDCDEKSASLDSAFENGLRVLAKVMQEVERLDEHHPLPTSDGESDADENALSRELDDLHDSGDMIASEAEQDTSSSRMSNSLNHNDEEETSNDGRDSNKEKSARNSNLLKGMYDIATSEQDSSHVSESWSSSGEDSDDRFPSFDSSAESTLSSVLQQGREGIGAIRPPWNKYLDESEGGTHLSHSGELAAGIGATRSPWGSNRNHYESDSSCSRDIDSELGSLASSSGCLSSLTQSISQQSLSTCDESQGNTMHHMNFLASNSNAVFMTPTTLMHSVISPILPEAPRSRLFNDEAANRLSNDELWEIYGCKSRKDAMKLALDQSNSLGQASSDLVELLFKYLREICGVHAGVHLFNSDSEESTSIRVDRNANPSQKGITLPASAISWLASYLYPDQDDNVYHEQWDTDEDSDLLPNASPAPRLQNKLSLLKILLAKHITHLRITGESWPYHQKEKRGGNGTGFTPRKRGKMLLNFDAKSTYSFLSFYRHLQNHPRLDMKLFPNLSYLQVDGVPPEWLQNMQEINHSLAMLTIQRGCIMNVSALFERKDELPLPQHENDASRIIFGQRIFDGGLLSPSPIKREENEGYQEILENSSSLFPQLEHLNLSHCGIGELSGMIAPKTTDVSGEGKQVDGDHTSRCYGALSSLIGLKTIDLSHNELVYAQSALAGLGELTKLSAINLSHNKLHSMRGTNTMIGNITVLLLANNNIENVCGLERLYSLKKLDLTNNKIKELCDVSALAQLPNLMELNLKGNPIVKRGTKRNRAQIFNIFKESRFDINDRSLTYRDLVSLLPQLDNQVILNKELVMLRYLSYGNSTTLDIDSDKNVATIAGDIPNTKEINNVAIESQESVTEETRTTRVQIHLPQRGHRIKRQASRTTAVINDECCPTGADISGRVGKCSKVVLKKQDFRPSQFGITVSLEEVIRYIRPVQSPLYLDDHNIDDSESEGDLSNCCERSETANWLENNDPDLACPDSQENENNGNSAKSEETFEDAKFSEDILETNSSSKSTTRVDEELAKPCKRDSETSSENEADLSHNLSNLIIDDAEISIECSAASSISTVIAANITLKEKNPDSEYERLTCEVTGDSSNIAAQTNLDENTSMDISKPLKEKVDFAASERNSEFSGPTSYADLFVPNYFDLYCRCFVFPPTDRVQDIDPFDDKSVGTFLPRIQLYQTDRELMMWTTIQQSGEKSDIGTALHNNSYEKLVAVSKEYILPCGIAATARIPPKDTTVKGFKGNTLYDAGNPFTMSDGQNLLICISNAALYIIPSFGDISLENRRFPSPIPSNATFKDALWPHAYCRHPLKFLRKISFDGFGFQRLTLHFKLPGLRGEVYVEPENGLMSTFDYSYVLFTCNQRKTIKLMQNLQEAAGKDRVLVENADNEIIQAVDRALSRSNFSDDILHYQILHQAWPNQSDKDARRSFVLTSEEALLFNETYSGDSSACALAEDIATVRYGDISMRTIASATLDDITDVSIAKENPRLVIVSVKSQNRLRWSTTSWVLRCSDRENAERLVSDLRKACS